jgi:hypothetical protein
VAPLQIADQLCWLVWFRLPERIRNLRSIDLKDLDTIAFVGVTKSLVQIFVRAKTAD